MTKRQLHAQIEAATCKPSGNVEGHPNFMYRLKMRLKTVGMTIDDAAFCGMLASSLPSNKRFDRLGGLVDTSMDCVNTPEKVVEMAITFDKANKADSHLSRSFGNGNRQSGNNQQPAQNGDGSGGKKFSNKDNNVKKSSGNMKKTCATVAGLRAINVAIPAVTARMLMTEVLPVVVLLVVVEGLPVVAAARECRRTSRRPRDSLMSYYFPDRTSSGRSDYDLPAVGRDGARDANDDSEGEDVDMPEVALTSPSSTREPWHSNPLPTFSDDIVLPPEQPRAAAPGNGGDAEPGKDRAGEPTTIHENDGKAAEEMTRWLYLYGGQPKLMEKNRR
ncbi:hypothetical protein JG687_00015510 [Phytophthora cactorum]|nr:hypothetical protein JG687_00015510 [Phytophthora cactorum]